MGSYALLKKLLFRLDAENAHNLTETILSLSNAVPMIFNPFVKENFFTHEMIQQEIYGIRFLNPVGLAAGFDKNATMIRAVQAMGFGFTEVGTVTPLPQDGNPKPRLFRHVREESIQNAMGFNNEGALAMRKRLQEIFPFSTPVGINIGKNKNTPEESAIEDYHRLIKELHDLGDYITINISSPNTPGLRNLHNFEFINELFSKVEEYTSKPIFLKISPDMELSEAIEVCSHAIEAKVHGIIIANTTTDYSLVSHPLSYGGLSGACIKEKHASLFEALAKEFFGKTTLISVGGIDSPDEAYKRIKAGASLVQIYSALIYKGPGLIKAINEGVVQRLHNDGFKHIRDAIGCERI